HQHMHGSMHQPQPMHLAARLLPDDLVTLVDHIEDLLAHAGGAPRRFRARQVNCSKETRSARICRESWKRSNSWANRCSGHSPLSSLNIIFRRCEKPRFTIRTYALRSSSVSGGGSRRTRQMPAASISGSGKKQLAGILNQGCGSELRWTSSDSTP